MSADKTKPGNSKNLPASPAVPARKIVLFRRVDWITFALTTLLVFIGITSPWLRTWIGRFRGACGRIDVRGCAPSARVPGMDALHMAFHADPVLEYRLAGGLSSAVAARLHGGLLALMVSRGSSCCLKELRISRDWIGVWKRPFAACPALWRGCCSALMALRGARR